MTIAAFILALAVCVYLALRLRAETHYAKVMHRDTVIRRHADLRREERSASLVRAGTHRWVVFNEYGDLRLERITAAASARTAPGGA
jgi:hypothetical protein